MDFVIILLATILVPVLVLVATIGLLAGIVRLIALFAVKRNDPQFGAMRYQFGVWQGSVRIERKRVDLFLPGNRKDILPGARELAQTVIASHTKLQEEFLPRFAEEIAEEPNIVPPKAKSAAGAGDFETLAKYSKLSEISVEKHPDKHEFRAWIAYLHHWDQEHRRSLVLNEKLVVEDYGMTVGL